MSNSIFSAPPDGGGLMVWLGTPFFAPCLRELGWEVILAEHDPAHPRSWDDVLALSGGKVPQVLVTADNSIPPPVTGMEYFPCLTVFYAIDSHIHSWYPLYGMAFDLCLVSLLNDIPKFTRRRYTAGTVRWSPPFALDEHRPPHAALPTEWDLLFVGTVDSAPERYAFLAEAQARFPGLHITDRRGFQLFYPRAKLVLNECTHGELNFRVFEALGCGACLLTPDIGPPLTELFTDGKELFLYPQRDVSAMLELTHRLLGDEELRQKTAGAGLAVVDSSHRASHRAVALDDWLRSLFASGRAEILVELRRRLAAFTHRGILRTLYLLHAESITDPRLRQAYLRAAARS